MDVRGGEPMNFNHHLKGKRSRLRPSAFRLLFPSCVLPFPSGELRGPEVTVCPAAFLRRILTHQNAACDETRPRCLGAVVVSSRFSEHIVCILRPLKLKLLWYEASSRLG